MAALRRTLLVLFIVTLSGFSAVWIYYLREGKKLNTEAFAVAPLRVIANPTFVSTYGPGPSLVRQFEARCRCRVELLSAGESSLILEM